MKVHLEVVFPKFRYFKMLEWGSSVLQCEYPNIMYNVHRLWTCIGYTKLHVFLNMVIIKPFSCDLQIILLFYMYSSTKSILLTGHITCAVLVKLQYLHHPSFIIQYRHYVNVKIQVSLWFKRTCNHLWNSSITKREKRWMIPIQSWDDEVRFVLDHHA